jgi:hypothetical protein
MSALSKILRDAEGGLLIFWCQGCDQCHGVRVDGKKPSWTWNGDAEHPTFTPSILVRHYRISPEGMDMIKRGDPPLDGDRYPGADIVCHSWVTEGRIKYLNDCTHALAGKTIDLPVWTDMDH